MVPYKEIDPASPITSAFEAVHMPFVGGIIAVGALIGMASVLLAVLIGLPRILMAMARDGLVPTWAAKVHPRTGTPIMTTIIATVVVSLSAGLLPIDAIASLTGVGTLTAFAAVCASVVVLRAREPNLPRPFRVPGPRWISLVGTLICLALILQLLPSLWLPLLMWMTLGAAIYALYGYRNSTLRRATAARNSSNMSTS
jgi:APA family basic amino acid/polyamine antiporter